MFRHNQCHYYLAKKNRYCLKSHAKGDQQYCSIHQRLTNQKLSPPPIVKQRSSLTQQPLHV